MNESQIQKLAVLIAEYGYWSTEVYEYSSRLSDGIGFDAVMKAHAKAKLYAKRSVERNKAL